VSELFEDYWNWRMERSPEFASFTGNKDFNNKLEIFTEKRFKDDQIRCKEFLKSANSLMTKEIDIEVKFSLRILKKELQTFIDGYPHKGFYFPISFKEGIQVDFQDLIGWSNLKTASDYYGLLERYEAFSVYVDQVIKMMDIGLKKGFTNHQTSMDGVVDQCMEHIGNITDTAFYKPFRILTMFSQKDQKDLQSRAASLIKNSIQPGFLKLINFLNSKYLKATRKNVGVGSLSDTFYPACLKFHTDTNLTAKEIHDIGLKEVERIENEMKKIMEELGHGDITLKQFQDKMKKDPSNYFKSKEELLEAVKDIIENKIAPKILTIFKKEPKIKLEIVEKSPSQANSSTASYLSGTADGSRPGRFYVNTNHFSSFEKYALLTLCLHESNPGHHFESSHSLEKTDWPTFRTIKEDRIYSQVPSRFPLNTAFSEGWGLYSETLGYDLGLYGNPLDRFGHLTYDMYRAVRLVVDTGIHAFNWSQEKAIQYMLNKTGVKEEKIRREIRRYITWPGQATAYKIGQVKILELRKMAEEQLGKRFELKDFHEVVLNSTGPLDLLEERVLEYIRASKLSGFYSILLS